MFFGFMDLRRVAAFVSEPAARVQVAARIKTISTACDGLCTLATGRSLMLLRLCHPACHLFSCLCDRSTCFVFSMPSLSRASGIQVPSPTSVSGTTKSLTKSFPQAGRRRAVFVSCSFAVCSCGALGSPCQCKSKQACRSLATTTFS